MKRILITTVALAMVALSGLNAQDHKQNLTPGEGFSHFDKLVIEGVYEVIIEQGEQAALFVTTIDTANPGLKFKVENGAMTIKQGSSSPVSGIYIIHTGLRDIKLVSAVELQSANPLSGGYLHLDLSGASEVRLALDLDVLMVDVSGASALKLTGRADTVQADILGAAEYDAMDLVTISTEINVAGAADAKVNARDRLVGQVSGIGNIKYDNEPAFVDIKRSGLSDVRIIEGTGDTIKVKVGKQEITIVDDDSSKPRRKTKFNGHWDGIELHLNNYVNPDYQLSVPDPYGFLDPDLGKSIGVNLNIFQTDFNLVRNHLGLITGLGLSYNNYRLNPDIVLKDFDETIGAVTDTIHDNLKSKLRVTHLTFPLILEYQTNNKSKLNSFHIGAGVIFGYRIGAKTKNVYAEDQQRIRLKSKGDFHLNPIRLEATGRIGLGKVNLFMNYDLLPMFREGEGPELYPVSLGISLVGW